MAKRTRTATYPTDLTDAEWALIEGSMPPPVTGGRQRDTDLRAVVNAVLYVEHFGCSWRMLPKGFPPPTTVYEYLSRWRKDGTLTKIRDTLQRPAKQRSAKNAKREPR